MNKIKFFSILTLIILFLTVAPKTSLADSDKLYERISMECHSKIITAFKPKPSSDGYSDLLIVASGAGIGFATFNILGLIGGGVIGIIVANIHDPKSGEQSPDQQVKEYLVYGGGEEAEEKCEEETYRQAYASSKDDLPRHENIRLSALGIGVILEKDERLKEHEL